MAKHGTDELYDYGKLNVSRVNSQSAPSSVNDVIETILMCNQRQQGLRLRGSGHTFNGCSLPSQSEHLLRTHNLDWFKFEKVGTVDVGAGAMVWDVRDMIRDHGYEMPVYNGGWAGPTIGGYISAGGIGKGELSSDQGGFWEHVERVTFVDMLGNLVTVDKDDAHFKWLFGSCGQLGVIVEARLTLLPTNRLAERLYPIGAEGKVSKRQEHDPFENDNALTKGSNVLYWFSLFVAPEDEQLAWECLFDFYCRHKHELEPEGGWAGPMIENSDSLGYRYEVKFKTFNPPLVYPRNETFLVLGVMSRFSFDAISSRSRIVEIEHSFNNMALKNGFYLYLQAENISNSIDRKTYFGEDKFNYFRKLKTQYDPRFSLNKAAFF